MEDLLESIVGNIQDEFDHEEDEVTALGDHIFDVDGAIDMEELGELLDVKLPDGDYDTLAGFIMDELGRIPGEDEQPVVVYENVTFTVLKMDDRRIDRVHIEVAPPPEPEPEETGREKRNRDKDEKDKETAS